MIIGLADVSYALKGALKLDSHRLRVRRYCLNICFAGGVRGKIPSPGIVLVYPFENYAKGDE